MLVVMTFTSSDEIIFPGIVIVNVIPVNLFQLKISQLIILPVSKQYKKRQSLPSRSLRSFTRYIFFTLFTSFYGLLLDFSLFFSRNTKEREET